MKKLLLVLTLIVACLVSAHSEEKKVLSVTIKTKKGPLSGILTIPPIEKDDLKQETTQVEVESIGKEKVNLTLKRHAEGVNREDVEEIAEVSVTLEEEEYKLSTIGITSGGVTFTVNGTVNGKDIKIKIIYDRPDNKTISEITGVHK